MDHMLKTYNWKASKLPNLFSTYLRLAGALLAIVGPTAQAHEDMDLGVVSVMADHRCYLEVTIKNLGRSLPDSFYHIEKPAYITIRKDHQQENLESLSALDTQRQLQTTGGTLVVRSRLAYAQNPHPVLIELHPVGEFVDHGTRNNRLHASLDCRLGVGQIDGAEITPTQPDIAIQNLRIDPATCRVSARFENLTPVALSASSWKKEQGVVIAQFDGDTSERKVTESLGQLDSQQRFTVTQKVFEWSYPLPQTNARHWRVGMWYVPDDANFANNQAEVHVPKSCRHRK